MYIDTILKHTHIHTLTHTYTHTNIRARAHTHIHTHTSSDVVRQRSLSKYARSLMVENGWQDDIFCGSAAAAAQALVEGQRGARSLLLKE